MSFRRGVLVTLTLALAAGVATIRLTGEFGWAVWLIGVASFGAIALLATSPVDMLGEGRRRIAHLSAVDLPVILAAILGLTLCAWNVGAAATATVAISALWKTAWEELWFRGLWLEGVGQAVWGAIVGSLIFCAMHVPETPVRAFTLLLLSGLYYALRAGRVSLIALISLHAAVNTTSSLGGHPLMIAAVLTGLALVVLIGRRATSRLQWSNA
jgi:hypothetical protein